MLPGHAHSPDAGRAKRSPLQRICGWCRVELTPGLEPATYVICARCHLKIERETMRHYGGLAREPFAPLSERNARA